MFLFFLGLLFTCSFSFRFTSLPTATVEELGKLAVSNPACVEGFYFSHETFFMSVGMWGESRLQWAPYPEPGKSLSWSSKPLPNTRIFAEGIAEANETHVWMLTYQAKQAYLWQVDPPAIVRTVSIVEPREGWGLTVSAKDDTMLILSDSTETLQLRDRASLDDTKKTLVVHARKDGGQSKPITRANELESLLVGDTHFLLANHFMTQDLLVLNGDTGEVLCVADLSSFNQGVHRTPSCGPPTANGIAYDAATNRLWLTGKYWYFIYEVKLTLADGTIIGGGL